MIRSGRIKGVTAGKDAGDVVVVKQITDGYVPYEGAITSVNLGSNNLVVGGAGATSQRQLRAGTSTSWIDIGEWTAANSLSAMYFNQATPGTTNYGILSDGATLILNAPLTGNNVSLRSANTVIATYCGQPTSAGGGSINYGALTVTGAVASAPITKLTIAGNSIQFLTGALTTQEEVFGSKPTYSFLAASVLTNASFIRLQAPTGGTNATLTHSAAIYIPASSVANTTNGYGIRVFATTAATNNYAAFFGGNSVVLSDAALATNATRGFTYIPTCAGIPSGVPAAETGTAAMVYDSTNNKLYVYGGGIWNIMN